MTNTKNLNPCSTLKMRASSPAGAVFLLLGVREDGSLPFDMPTLGDYEHVGRP